MYVNDTSTGITLDPQGADNSYVSAYNDGEDHLWPRSTPIPVKTVLARLRWKVRETAAL